MCVCVCACACVCACVRALGRACEFLSIIEKVIAGIQVLPAQTNVNNAFLRTGRHLALWFHSLAHCEDQLLK